MENDDYKDCKRKLKEMGVEYNHPLHPANKFKVIGVSFKKIRNAWAVVIFSNHKRIHLGEFKKFEDCSCQYISNQFGRKIFNQY